MRRREQIYELILRAARPLLGTGWGHAGLAQALAGRRDALPRLRAWAGAHRGSAPLVLVHAPSVGEALMAQAIIAALRHSRPDLQVAFTFFSPSAERMAARVGADIATYLPWDTRSDARALLDALTPVAIAFVRTEIWPVLGAEAAARGVPSLLLNAVLSEGSSRLRPAARLLLGPGYRRLQAIGAVAGPDGQRFAAFGVDPRRVHITGDARFDQVWARTRQLDPELPLLQRLRGDRLTLVAGSTWPADERILSSALAQLSMPPRLILAPHQPTAEHLARAERTFAAAGMPLQRLADLERGSDAAERVLVDRVGVLADLYAIADLAYVGGGFGTTGLHSVVEPAALGVPVLFGPRSGNAREAGELAAAGGGRVIDEGSAAAALGDWLGNEDLRAAAGEAAGAFVRERLGGAGANAQLLLASLR